MASLRTTYMGMTLASPVIAGASALTANLKTLRQMEEAGAGAVVTASLFEEQIHLEELAFDEDLHRHDNLNAEMIAPMAALKHAGPAEHLLWVRKAKAELAIPVIGSVNAVQEPTWLDYARRMADTGVGGLECNFFASPRDSARTGADIENEQVDLAAKLVQAVPIPVSFKLSTFYTNPLHVIRRLDQAGAAGFVLFNRLFEPDIDLDTESFSSPFNLSHDTDYRLPLRYAGLLEGQLRAHLCCSGGVFQGEHVAKAILAGAHAVQVVTTLYHNGIPHLRTMVRDLQAWMDKQGYSALDNFRGALSQRHVADPRAYTRGQYVALLMNPKPILAGPPLP
jgi:dihydroorotate dehydrogenase (fumarate)